MPWELRDYDVNITPKRHAYETWMREKALRELGWSPGQRQAHRQLLYPEYDQTASTALETAFIQASRLNEDKEFVRDAFAVEFATRTGSCTDVIANRLFRQSYFDDARDDIAPPQTPPPLSEYAAAVSPHGAAGGHHGHYHGGPADGRQAHHDGGSAGGHHHHYYGGSAGGHQQQHHHGGSHGGHHQHKSVQDGHHRHTSGHQGQEQYPYPYK
jgi:hypothetical protein